MCSLTLAGLSMLLARDEAKQRKREMVSGAFLCWPGDVTQAEWRQPFSLYEICNFESLTVKAIPAQNDNLKL